MAAFVTQLRAAAEGSRRAVAIPLLALCLALMTATRYYAVFFLVPLFVVEMIRWWDSGNLDFGVLGAMVASPLVLALHYALILANKPFHQHFWANRAFAGHTRVVLPLSGNSVARCVSCSLCREAR